MTTTTTITVIHEKPSAISCKVPHRRDRVSGRRFRFPVTTKRPGGRRGELGWMWYRPRPTACFRGSHFHLVVVWMGRRGGRHCEGCWTVRRRLIQPCGRISRYQMVMIIIEIGYCIYANSDMGNLCLYLQNWSFDTFYRLRLVMIMGISHWYTNQAL